MTIPPELALQLYQASRRVADEFAEFDNVVNSETIETLYDVLFDINRIVQTTITTWFYTEDNLPPDAPIFILAVPKASKTGRAVREWANVVRAHPERYSLWAEMPTPKLETI